MVTRRSPHLPDDRGAALAALREHLSELQMAQIAHNRRAIIIFEGPMAAGKKAALRQLASAFDPCHYAVHCTRRDRREASEGHWLARFWRQLPPAGDTAIFFRSWYRRVLDDRISGMVDDKAARRAFDEINEFEAQQRDYGTLIVKLYFEVSAAVQQKRLNARAAQPNRDSGSPLLRKTSRRRAGERFSRRRPGPRSAPARGERSTRSGLRMRPFRHRQRW